MAEKTMLEAATEEFLRCNGYAAKTIERQRAEGGMSQSIATITPQLPAPRITSATSDDELVDSWLRVKGSNSPNTSEAYARIAGQFRAFFDYKPLASLKIDDLADYADSIKGAKVSTQRQRLFAVKSLLSYGQKTGYLQFNVGAALQAPKAKTELASKLLTEEDIFKLIHAEPKTRNQLLLRLLYVSAARISEALALTWKDLTPREQGGQVTIFGKGGKTRFVIIPDPLWSSLNAERRCDDEPVFHAPKTPNKPLCRKAGWYIIKQAVKRSGINWKASCHWLRHAHATHALKRSADIKLVSTTLGHSSVAITNVYLDVQPGESSSTYLMGV